jgi:N-acetylmuramoyl-L-alanine amidase
VENRVGTFALSFRPDSKLVSDIAASPNFEPRVADRRPDMLLLHYTGMKTSLAALARLREAAEPRVSSHYFVDEDGTIIQLVAERERAWHAGLSFWAGETDINSCSIGIEIVNPGHEFGYPDFPPHQIGSVIALCKDIVERHGIRADRVLAHSDVAPGRKQDPGEKFPWERLHLLGVGHWTQPSPLRAGAQLAADSSGEDVSNLQIELSAYGYGVPVTGSYDTATQDAITAFQRHFRQARVDGIADASTRATLANLLATRPLATA